MKLYHIDRSNSLKCGILLLNNSVEINADNIIKEMLKCNIKKN